jgi:hypothetical protein
VIQAGTALVFAGVLGACTDATSAGPLFDSEVVTPDQLAEVEPVRLFRHTETGIRADSLLPILYISGVRFSEARDPIAHECDSPLVPRLTLVVNVGASQTASFGFVPGDGIEACTTSVRRYTPAD